jgi:hypothetical protein
MAAPYSIFSASYATILTIFTNRIEWSGFRYTFRFTDGKVTKVEKLER